MVSSSSLPNLAAILQQLSPTETEANICHQFINPFLEYLSFGSSDLYMQFPTGQGTQRVDYAIQKGGNFKTPEILLEAKGRATDKGKIINLSSGTKDYQDIIEQINRYLLSPNCKSVKWGMITNANHFQLFRKYGKVIHPATTNLKLDHNNIQTIANQVKNIINTPKKALTVAVYNNKGGVGKTTTVVNLASLLTLYHRKVLVIDLDPIQHDLSNAIDMGANGSVIASNKLSDIFLNPKIPLVNAISQYKTPFKSSTRKLTTKGFDIILGDPLLDEPQGDSGAKLANLPNVLTILDKKLESIRYNYDYIIIDTCPNWNLFSQLTIYASDVVLIPAQHNNVYSLENAAISISKFIPEMQKERQKMKGIFDHGPVALPIFINGANPKDLAKVYIQQTIKGIASNYGVLSYFLPHYAPGKPSIEMCCIPEYEIITKYAFSKRPAAYAHLTAFNYYNHLVKEYFLQ